MSKTVMCVDDEANLLKLYEQILCDEGYQVITARSGREALDLVRAVPIDLVVLDIKMGNENGLDVLAEIKRKDPLLPVVLHSAFNTYKADFKSWLANEYLVKTPDLRELKAKIGRLLDDRTSS